MERDFFEDITVVKRSGQRVNFNDTKVALAIKKGFDSVYEDYDEKEVNKVKEKVLDYIKKEYKDRKTIGVDSITEIVNSDEYSSIKEISYNKDFTEFDITVDQNAFNNSMDGFVIFSLAISSTYYNGLDGKSDDLKLTMNMIDEATGKEYDSFIFPDDLEDEENTETE